MHQCKAVPIIFQVESIHSISKEIFLFFVRRTHSNSQKWESPASMEVPGNRFGREDKNICRNSKTVMQKHSVRASI